MGINEDNKEQYLKKENNQLKNQLQENKKIIEKLKLKLTKYYNETKDKDEVIGELQFDIKNLTNKVNEKDNIIKNKQSEIQEFLIEKKHLNKFVNTNSTLKKKIEDLTKENIKLKDIIKSAKTRDEKEIELHKAEQKMRMLLQEISGLKNTNKSLKENVEKRILEDEQFYNSRRYGKSISTVIERLSRELSIKNVSYYGRLQSISDRVKRILDYKDSISNKGEALNKFTGNKVLYGYVVEKNEKLKFIEIDGTSYNINYIDNTYYVDIPASAVLIDDETVQILNFYNNYEIQEINNKVVRETNKTIKDIEINETVPMENLNILIVTGRNGKYYKQYLDKYGFNVEVYNPYEESINQFGNKMSSQDIVIIMKNAVPHLITDAIDQNDRRIEIIGKDNKQYILARIRYHIAINICEDYLE
jgi:hypothetical protein